MLPSLFISHGSPMLALETGATQSFLTQLGRNLGVPKAIVVVSAHWETLAPTVSEALLPETIHDFGGFPSALHAMQYRAPGAPEVGRRAVSLLRAAGFGEAALEDRGLDHGAWVPLSLMFPRADVPVTQVSIQPDRSPAHHARLGAALRPLREAGVLLLASGSLTHNLAEVRGRPVDELAAPWVVEFAEWIAKAVERGHADDLLNYRRVAPHTQRNHPTDEHLLPLFVALGSGTVGSGRRIHRATTYGALSMDAFAFD